MENKDFKVHKKYGEFKTFGQYLKEGMDRKGISRASLSDKIAEKGYTVSEKEIKLWEKDAWYPDITMIYILAEIFEIHPNDLLEAKQFMQEVGLNSIDMLTMRVVCNFIDVSIWKVHCFLNVFKWFILIGLVGFFWGISIPWIMILLFVLSILAAIYEYDGV